MREGFKKLKVYRLAFQCAGEIFEMTKSFPKEEKYSLTDQIRRSSRSICANIAEGYRKRIYPSHFKSKISDSDAECSETIVWLDFSRDCGYISSKKHADLVGKYELIGKMLGKMIQNPKKFRPRNE